MKTRWGWLVLIFALISVWVTALSPASAQINASKGVTGEWRGMIGKQHLVLNLNAAATGELSGKLIVPDQGNVTFANSALHLAIKAIGASYDAKLNEAGDSLSGTWEQGGVNIPFVLRRPGAVAPAMTLKPRTIGQVALTPCTTTDGNTEGLCGSVSVWENRVLKGEGKTGRKLALRVMVLPSTSDHPSADAFVPLAGGPGQSAVEAYPLTGFTNAIRKTHDVVLLDQRGTGGSAPLLCDLRDPDNVQQTIGEEMPPEKLRACRATLEKTADLTQYTTSIFADDLDEVRAALGYTKIDVFGTSYGTRAALVYLRRHAEHVRAIGLEGVVSPEYRIPLSFSHALQGSIDQILARCAADEPCNKAYPNLRQEFQTLLDRLDKSPTQAEVTTAKGKQTVTITRGIFVADLRPILYIPQVINQLPYILHKAYEGDWSVYASVAAQVRGAIDKSINRDLSLSVSCSEDIPGMTEERIAREAAGTYLGDFQVRQYQRACKEWVRGEVPEDFHAAIRSDVPALLISGALDPVTSPDVSRNVAHNLSNSQVVLLPNGTHGTGSACVDGIVAAFVDTATKVDASCVNAMKLGDFFVHP
jgi:pimeloyl-ACP methyl ester carboxylesterase